MARSSERLLESGAFEALQTPEAPEGAWRPPLEVVRNLEPLTPPSGSQASWSPPDPP